jgi:hypothetical protein
MQTISCDVCRKRVDNSITGRTFFYLGEHNICEACKDNLEFQIKPTVRTKDPFSYEWYTRLIMDSLSKSVSKGK